MKIVQLLPELNEGGVERGTVELARELVKQGFKSIVISNGGKLVKQLESEGSLHLKCDVCSKNPLSSISRVLKLQKLIKELKPDVLHVRSRVPAWLVYFANKSLKIPVVSTVHGFNSVSFYSRIMTNADKVICVSMSIKEYIKKHYKTPEEKITIIPRGIDLVKFNPNNLDENFIVNFKKEFNLNDKFVVTTVGRITQLKDLETFIKAISIIQTTLPDIVGLIVGGVREDKQNYFKTLQDLVKSLHVNIFFTGSQSNVAEIYSLSDVVTSSSKKPESFGRSVAEALALNTPVIATNHGGVLDIIEKNINGYFVEIGDEKEFAKKIILAKELKFDGYNYVKENFSLEQMVEKTVKIYKSLES
jgi:glycosyltransferase involved in cell wall biosynthesis